MKKLFVTLLLLLPLSSHALFEVRAGYGSASPETETYNGGSVDDMTGFNLDVLVKPPLISDMGFGLRYEKMKADVGTTGEAELERIAALVNYRFIDLFAYFGVIGSVGLSNDLTYTDPTTTLDFDAKLNYSVGLEGGINLGLIHLGVEVGKFFGEFELAGNPDLDLSGMYWKGLVGFGF